MELSEFGWAKVRKLGEAIISGYVFGRKNFPLMLT
jgi:hypothetical protein